MFKKVLVACPTAAIKNYCFEQWLDNVMSFTYPNFRIRMFDNTLDNGANADKLNSIFKEKYGDSDKFAAYSSQRLNSEISQSSVIERMAVSHNHCRNYALNNDFDFMLHLESDVFPQADIIEELLFCNKPVVGAVYYRDEGIFRKAMLQDNIYHSERSVGSVNHLVNQELITIDGSVKKFASIGLGCALIAKPVMAKIPFRFVKNRGQHPDTYFSEDCLRFNIPIYANTACIARHDNKPWGQYGKDFK